MHYVDIKHKCTKIHAGFTNTRGFVHFECIESKSLSEVIAYLVTKTEVGRFRIKRHKKMNV